VTTTLYRHFDSADVLLYVGISGSPGRRFDQHAGEQSWWSEVARTSMEHYPSRTDALAAERQAITAEQPRYNVHHGPLRRRRRSPHSGPVTVDPALAVKLRTVTERIGVMQARVELERADRDRLVVEALDAGGSLREVAALAGLSGPGVMKIRDRVKGDPR